MIIEKKDPIRDPDIRLQKWLNWWQNATQLALAFPLCAKYTMLVATEAPEIADFYCDSDDMEDC